MLGGGLDSAAESSSSSEQLSSVENELNKSCSQSPCGEGDIND